MPQLSDLIEKKKFVKKEYRPWDLSGTGTVDNKRNTKESIKTEPDSDNIVEEQPANIDQFVEIEANLSIEAGNKSDNVLDNNKITAEKQSDNIEITRQKQRDNIKVTPREQTYNIIDNRTDNTGDELAYLIDSIKKLAGIQKNLFWHILNVCSARGVLDTGNILSLDLANAANCSIGSAKTSLIRLLEKHLVIRFQGKASRGGHMVLGITKEIQAAAIQAQQALYNPLKMTKTDNNTGNITNNMSSYSSSNIYKNNTTTSLPEDWKKINFEHLSSIGFSETQLRQLHDSHSTIPEIVQDAINRFAYSLENNEKVKAYSDPLNVLMGVLRKGQRWNEPNYIPPKELALRQLVEDKRKQKERFDAMVKELIELEFPEWKRNLSEDQIKEILPADVRKTNIKSAIDAALRTYFTETVLFPRLELEGVIN
jgi:hypothetical protein